MLAPTIANAAPEKEPHGSAAGLVGLGIDVPGEDVFFGLGLRGGYTLRPNIYVGGMFMYHFIPTFASSGLYTLGVEGGYDFNLEPVVIRPYLGVGLGHSFFEREGGSHNYSQTVLSFSFGATVLFNVNEQWFIGADFRVPTVPDGDGEVLFFPTPSVTGGLSF